MEGFSSSFQVFSGGKWSVAGELWLVLIVVVFVVVLEEIPVFFRRCLRYFLLVATLEVCSSKGRAGGRIRHEAGCTVFSFPWHVLELLHTELASVSRHDSYSFFGFCVFSVAATSSS